MLQLLFEYDKHNQFLRPVICVHIKQHSEQPLSFLNSVHPEYRRMVRIHKFLLSFKVNISLIICDSLRVSDKKLKIILWMFKYRQWMREIS